jgi:signal transduction histidine kinase/ActR/RegA family two-component response regulator
MNGSGIVLALAIALLASWVFVGRRRVPSAGSLWAEAWLVLYLGGLIETAGPFLPGAHVPNHVTGPLFAGLMLAGTLVFCGAAVPRWLVPLALGIGIGRVILVALGMPVVAYVGANLLETAAEIGAAWVVWARRRPAPRPLSETLLAPALLLVAAADGAYLYIELSGGDRWPGRTMWVLATLITSLVQLRAVLTRQLERETALRREVEHQARGLAAEHRTVLALLEATPAGIILADRDDRVRLLNQAAVRLLGGDCQGRPAGEVLRAWGQELADAAPLAGVLRSVEQDPKVTVSWLELQTAERPARQVDMYTAPVLGDDGEHLGRIWIARDITEYKTLERQFLQAQKLESLGLLAGGVAHDFNNLLGVILGNAELLSAAVPPSAPGSRNLTDIQEAGMRAADLCLQMLAYAGKGRFVVEPIELSRTVAEMAQLLQSSFSKKIAFEFQLADDLPAIEGDATQIRQLIMNVVANAAEAIGDRPGVIRVATGPATRNGAASPPSPEWTLEGTPPDGPAVSLEVADTGCGMDEETRARMFDPFFSTKFTGRGLGLAGVLGIVRGHKGAVAVRSVPGQGTTFEIVLPACDGLEVAPAPAQAATDAWRATGTILLAEDEAGLREVTQCFLADAGFDVLTVSDGLEAVDVFRRRHGEIVAVLLDLTMPRMDGVEALRELRRIDPRTPVILMSGYTAERLGGSPGAEGAEAFLHKPYSFDELRALLTRVLGPRPPGGAPQ